MRGRRVLCVRCVAKRGGIERTAQRFARLRRRYRRALEAGQNRCWTSSRAGATKPDDGPSAEASVGVALGWRSYCAGFYAGSSVERKRPVGHCSRVLTFAYTNLYICPVTNHDFLFFLQKPSSTTAAGHTLGSSPRTCVQYSSWTSSMDGQGRAIDGENAQKGTNREGFLSSTSCRRQSSRGADSRISR